MNDTNSIKVQIANRTYPLKVTAIQEEILRKAAKTVNDRMKDYETAYAVKDNQDLLAMCALQLAAEQLGVHEASEDKQAAIKKELEALSELVKNLRSE